MKGPSDTNRFSVPIGCSSGQPRPSAPISGSLNSLFLSRPQPKTRSLSKLYVTPSASCTAVDEHKRERERTREKGGRESEDKTGRMSIGRVKFAEPPASQLPRDSQVRRLLPASLLHTGPSHSSSDSDLMELGNRPQGRASGAARKQISWLTLIYLRVIPRRSAHSYIRPFSRLFFTPCLSFMCHGLTTPLSLFTVVLTSSLASLTIFLYFGSVRKFRFFSLSMLLTLHALTSRALLLPNSLLFKAYQEVIAALSDL